MHSQVLSSIQQHVRSAGAHFISMYSVLLAPKVSDSSMSYECILWHVTGMCVLLMYTQNWCDWCVPGARAV